MFRNYLGALDPISRPRGLSPGPCPLFSIILKGSSIKSLSRGSMFQMLFFYTKSIVKSRSLNEAAFLYFFFPQENASKMTQPFPQYDQNILGEVVPTQGVPLARGAEKG